ncbi:DUF2914 domain-containing protein [candidate division KSB1 bacterium]|nr:DUF2914 domain-containing protein [candidate division KSB1 bacterium]
MGRKTEDKLDILRRLITERDELEEKLKHEKEQLNKLKFDKKAGAINDVQIAEQKSEIKETASRLKHADKQVAFFASQVGGGKNYSAGLIISLSLVMLMLGVVLGYYVVPVIELPGNKGPAEQMTICEFVYNGEPAGLGPTFEIGRTKTLHCYAEISPRSQRTDYLVEWYHKKEIKDTTPLPITAKGGKAWCQRKFALDEIGEWEAHLKTRDGNTWAITAFNLVYPKIEVPVAVICEDVLEDQPQNSGSVFLAKDRTLYCFTETSTKEKYTEVVHQWYHDNKLETSEKIMLEKLRQKNWSKINISAQKAGDWSVKILDGQGTTLNRVNFSVEKKKQSANLIELATGVTEGKPDSILSRFVADGNEYVFYSKVSSNFPGISIKQQWLLNNKLVFESPFQSEGLTAEFHSAHKISSKQHGTWTLRITDSKGEVLGSKKITATKPITEDVGINRLVFCRTVFQRDPYDIASRFKISEPVKIWAHATVNNKRSRTSITYKWFYNRKLIKQNQIKNIVPSRSYRTYDYKTIYPKQKGTWKVNVYAEDGTLLKSGQFVIESN